MSTSIENLCREILYEIDKMNNKIDIINKDIEEIKIKLEKNEDDNSKLNDHIDFVNNVYEKVEKPLNYVTYNFNKIRNIKRILPQLPQ